MPKHKDGVFLSSYPFRNMGLYSRTMFYPMSALSPEEKMGKSSTRRTSTFCHSTHQHPSIDPQPPLSASHSRLTNGRQTAPSSSPSLTGWHRWSFWWLTVTKMNRGFWVQSVLGVLLGTKSSPKGCVNLAAFQYFGNLHGHQYTELD